MTSNRNAWVPCWIVALLSGCATVGAPPEAADLREQVRQTELAFARTMAERDFDGFARFIDDEAVFLDGNDALRGKAAVLAAWRPTFAGPQAPFAWRPESVEVLASGSLAQSLGPVVAGDGRQVARFHSIWRRTGQGQWRIVFDKGYDVCGCIKP
jgi:ketosteroid isomerase-like protein